MILKEIIQKYRSRDTKALILLEHEEQVKNCLEWLDEFKSQKQIIALTPFAVYELDKHNVPYKIPEDYYDSEALFKLSENNYQKVEDICNLMDSSIQKASPVITSLGIKPALFSIYHLKMAYDAVTVCLFQLLRIIDAEKADVIFVYDTKSYPFGIPEEAHYLLFDNRESIYTHLLALAGWNVPVAVLPYVPQPQAPRALRKNYHGFPTRLKKKVLRWLQPHPRLLALAFSWRKSGWRGLFNSLKVYLPADKSISVLLLGEGYNWDNCEEELRSVGIGPVLRMVDDLGHWLSAPSPNKMDSQNILSAWEELQQDEEFRRFFAWSGIDFFPILEKRLRFLTERLTPACLKAYQETAELLKNKGIGAVLARTFGSGAGHAAAQSAHSLGVPVVVWQHGSCGYMHQPVVIYNDLMSADANFVFGEGVVEHYREPASRFGTQLVPVGSASLDVLTQSLRSAKSNRHVRLEAGRKVVLYVVPDFTRNNVYIALSPPISDNHWWHTQQAILDVLARHQDYTIVVKLHSNPASGNNLLALYAKEKSLVNCQFLTDECSFTDLLPLADVVVIDWPMTTLLEAVTTTKPVVVYAGQLHIDEEAQRLLERRASCHRESKDFLDALDNLLSYGSINMDLNDREFLKRYGTDGTSGMRAATALRQIINSYKVRKHGIGIS